MGNKPTYEDLEHHIRDLEQQQTDFERTTKQLVESEARFKALHDASFGGVIIHDKGLILDCNQGLSEITGFSSEELVGMNGLDLIAPDSLEQVLHNIRTGYDKSYEVEGVRKDGSVYPLAIRGKNIPYKGREVRVIEFRDVTERAQAEEALRESERLHGKMIANIGDVIVIIDENGTTRFKSPNVEKWFGWKPEDLVGRHALEHVHPEDAEAAGEVFEYFVRVPDATADFECRYKCKNGQYKWIAFTGVSLLSDPSIKGILGNYRDITKRRQEKDEKEDLENRLQQAQKMEAIGTLAGGIAHDFNNILGVILGYADLAREDAPRGSHFEQDIDHIHMAANRAKNLVKQILTFGRQTQAVRVPMQIQPLLSEGLKMLRSSIPSTISIVEDIDQTCEAISADPTQIHQILMNLCTNAYHAMEETGGVLTVSLKTSFIDADDKKMMPHVVPGQYLEFSVADTGMGIQPEVMSKIFDPYYTTKEIGKGTGMGLAIIHGILKQYGGAIVVESQLDKGSVFRAYFPVVEEDVLPDDAGFEDCPRGTERILLVDDEEMLCDLGKEILERLGYFVTARCNSLEALATFENNPDSFDLVLTDQTMPDLTGSDLAKRILEIRPDLPVILCTGYSNLIDEPSAKAIGIKAFALKPLKRNTIGTLVRQVLDDS